MPFGQGLRAGQFSACTVRVAHQSGFLYRWVAEPSGFDVGHRDHESATDAVGCPYGDAHEVCLGRGRLSGQTSGVESDDGDRVPAECVGVTRDLFLTDVSAGGPLVDNPDPCSSQALDGGVDERVGLVDE